jgi:hypothetical protein
MVYVTLHLFSQYTRPEGADHLQTGFILETQEEFSHQWIKILLNLVRPPILGVAQDKGTGLVLSMVA